MFRFPALPSALAAGLLLMAGCKPDSPSGYQAGKNRFTLMADGAQREYYVHVPPGYDPGAPTPLVFMLHGTSGDGEKYYLQSGWKEVGDAEGILTVYPSSGRHCIIADGARKTTTKWNSQPSADWQYCEGEIPKDDIQFFTAIIEEMARLFNLDRSRIYLVGFSNGGQMAAKCAIQMSNTFAAIVESAGSFTGDTVFVPQRSLPVTYQIGNEDYGPGGSGPAVPLSRLGDLIRTDAHRFHRIAGTHIRSFGLDSNFTMHGDTNTIVYAEFRPLSSDTVNVFNLALIKDLRHTYPNGEKHWLEAAEVNWNWLKQFRKP